MENINIRKQGEIERNRVEDREKSDIAREKERRKK